MVVHRPGAALEAFGVRHGFDFALDRLVLDLAVSLAQPVAVRVDALLHCVTVLPHLVALGHLRYCQAVREDRLDVGFIWQAILKSHTA